MTADLDRHIELLQRTPRVLRALLEGLPDEWSRADEGDDTWSPYDVVGHLIDGEETDWMVRIGIILEQGESVEFEPFDRFRHLRLDDTRTLAALLDRFEELRAQNLEALKALGITEEQLALPGRHPELGPVDLGQLLAAWVVHDLNHLAQIARVMAKQNAEAVGPWEAYLSILHR